MEEKIVGARFTPNRIAPILWGISGAWTAAGILSAVFAAPFHPAGVFGAVAAFLLAVGGVLAGVVLHRMMDHCSLTVTNRRIVGKAGFGRAVDLPLSQISAVTVGRGGRISIWTASGRLHFWLIENSEEIITALAQLVGGGDYCQQL